MAPTGEQLKYVLRICFDTSVNVAEFEALLHGLRIAVSLGIHKLMIWGDSNLVISQVTKDFACHNPLMEAYRDKVRKLEDKFLGLELQHVLRPNNCATDVLANYGSRQEPIPPGVFVEDLMVPSITKKVKPLATLPPEGGSSTAPDEEVPVTSKVQVPAVATVEPGQGELINSIFQVEVAEPEWIQVYLDFFTDNILPQSKRKANMVRRKSRNYVVHEDRLYRKSASGVLLRCLSQVDGQSLMRELHAGVCGNHAGPRNLVIKATNQGFYWPTALRDAHDIVKRCQGCQFYAKNIHVPSQELQMIPISWPFAVWGLDMVGPLRPAPGGFTHLFVAIDKFTKWIEVKPLKAIKAKKACEFLDEIMTRFGVPNQIITDNGTQFTAHEFMDYYGTIGIQVCFGSAYHPQSNGQIERANGLLLQRLKSHIHSKLEKFAGKWFKELPSVIWGLRTQVNRSTGSLLSSSPLVQRQYYRLTFSLVQLE